MRASRLNFMAMTQAKQMSSSVGVHNWPACPKEIEVMELSTLLSEAEQIDTQIKTTKKLTAWQEFCQVKRLEGLDFADIAKLWRKQRG